jgi:2-methylcitrate dehydratase
VKLHSVRTHKSSENLARADQLAWKIAEVASDPVAVEADVIEMIGNRIINNAAIVATRLTSPSCLVERSMHGS